MPEPLVLLPGLQSDHRSWLNQTRHFSASRQVIVPQRHQHCLSIAAMGEKVLEQLPPRFHLAASAGIMISASYFLRYSRFSASVILPSALA